MRNDFAEWVAETVLDFELARRIMGITDREDMAKAVAQRISELEAFGAHKPRQQALVSYAGHVRGEPAAL
jgi:hypothetical protein